MPTLSLGRRSCEKIYFQGVNFVVRFVGAQAVLWGAQAVLWGAQAVLWGAQAAPQAGQGISQC